MAENNNGIHLKFDLNVSVPTQGDVSRTIATAAVQTQDDKKNVVVILDNDIPALVAELSLAAINTMRESVISYIRKTYGDADADALLKEDYSDVHPISSPHDAGDL